MKRMAHIQSQSLEKSELAVAGGDFFRHFRHGRRSQKIYH